MSIRAVIFDIFGILLRIETNEWKNEIYRDMAAYLDYHKINIDPQSLQKTYFSLMKAQKNASQEKYPEIDVIAIWEAFLEARSGPSPRKRYQFARELVRLH